jgi:hypothetical protein
VDYIQLLLTPIKSDSVAKFVETLARYFSIVRKMRPDAQEINNLAHIFGRTLNANFEFSSGDIRNIHILSNLLPLSETQIVVF